MRYESSNNLQHGKFKYISRKLVGGKWQYIYPEDAKGGNRPRANYPSLTKNRVSQRRPSIVDMARQAIGNQKARAQVSAENKLRRPAKGAITKPYNTQNPGAYASPAKPTKPKSPVMGNSNISKKTSSSNNKAGQGTPKGAKLKTSINKFKAEAKKTFDKGKAFFSGKKPSEIKIGKSSLQGAGANQKTAANTRSNESNFKKEMAKYEKTFQGQLDKGKAFIDGILGKISNAINPRKASTASEADIRLNRVRATAKEVEKFQASKKAAAERAARDKAAQTAQRKANTVGPSTNKVDTSLASKAAANARVNAQKRGNVTDAAVEQRLASEARKTQSNTRKAATAVGPRTTTSSSTSNKQTTTNRSVSSVGGRTTGTSNNKTYTTRKNLNPASQRTNVSANTPYSTSNTPGNNADRDRIQRIKENNRRKRRSGVTRSR